MPKIKLTNGLFAQVDEEDVDLVSKKSSVYPYQKTSDLVWRCKEDQWGCKYAITMIRVSKDKWKSVRMHRWILGLTNPTQIVDHKNGDGLDNRRANLRLCTTQTNAMNQRAGRKNKTSRYKGVSKHKDGGWSALICHNYKSQYLGYFKSEIDAARAYDRKALELFGEFARINGV
jgi:hypothetical protein